MSEPTDEAPVPAVAVSPADRSSDREQSDADQLVNAAANADDRTVANAADERAVRERGEARLQAALDQGITEAKIDALIESNAAATQATHKLIETSTEQAAAADRFSLAMVEYQEREQKAKARFRATIKAIVVGFSVVTLVLLAGLVTVVAIGVASLHAASDGRDKLIDCVVPGGECYARGAANQGQVLGQVSNADLINSVCAARYTELPIMDAIDATRACVATVASR